MKFTASEKMFDKDKVKQMKSEIYDTELFQYHRLFPKDFHEFIPEEARTYRAYIFEHLEKFKQGLLKRTPDGYPDVDWDQFDITIYVIDCYINLGYHLSLEDRAKIVTYLYLVVEHFDVVDLSLQTHVFMLMTEILKKKKKLNLELNWKPLYRMLNLFYFGNYRMNIYTPKRHGTTLILFSQSAQRYFPSSATEEILEKFLPYLCLQDNLIFKGMACLCFFIPTSNDCSSWLPKIINVWKWVRMVPSWDSHVFRLLWRIAEDSPGTIDWNIYLESIFQKILPLLNLPTGSENVTIFDDFRINDCGLFTLYDFSKSGALVQAARFLSWILSPKLNTLEYLEKLFHSTEAFFHPSTDGAWTDGLADFLFSLVSSFTKRLTKERKKTVDIPEEHRITEEYEKKFVNLIYPLALKAMFSHSHTMQTSANQILKHFAYIQPDIIFPPLINQALLALQVVNETHQTVQALDLLSYIIFPLLKAKNPESGKQHISDLMNLSLPGIDANDQSKTYSTFKFFSALLVGLPCFGSKLTQDDGNAPKAVHILEDWSLGLLERLFMMIQNEQAQLSNSSKDSSNDLLFGVSDLFFNQMSSDLRKICMKRVFKFVTESFLLNAKELVGSLVSTSSALCSKEALELYIPHCYNHLVNGNGELKSTTDADKEWYLHLLSKSIYKSGDELLKYRKELWAIMKLFSSIEEKKINRSFSRLVKNILVSLTFYYSRDNRSENASVWAEFERTKVHWERWGQCYTHEDLELDFHFPTESELDMAIDLINTFGVSLVSKLRTFVDEISATQKSTINKHEVFNGFCLLADIIRGCGVSVWPEFSSEGADLSKSAFPIHQLPLYSGNSAYSKERIKLLPEEVLNLCRDAVDCLFKNQIEVSNLIPCILKVLVPLICSRELVTKQNHTRRSTSHSHIKQHNFSVYNLTKEKYPRYILLTHAQLPFQYRLVLRAFSQPYTEHHQRLIESMITLSMSAYEKVRKTAQTVLLDMSQKFSPDILAGIIPRFLEKLSDPKSSEHEMIGSLEFLCRNGILSAITESWELQSKFILNLCKTYHVTKDTIETQISELFDLYFSSTHEIGFQNSKDVAIYYQLISDLVSIVEENPYLHWRYLVMISSFFTILIRGDSIKFPLNGLEFLLTNLKSKITKVNVMAIEGVNLVLAQYKPVQARKTIKLPEGNLIDSYKTVKCIESEKEWLEHQFFEKNYFGWYKNPKEATVYDYSVPIEPNPDLVSLLRKIFTCEFFQEIFSCQKIAEDESFNESISQLYRGVFQILGKEFFDITSEFILKEAVKHAGEGATEETRHMSACGEYICGLIRGMKHWPWKDQQDSLNFLFKFWDEVIPKTSTNSISEWCDAIEYAVCDKDVVRVKPIALYFRKAFSESFKTNETQLQLRYTKILNVVAGEISWRDQEFIDSILEEMQAILKHPYQHVREQISNITSLIINVKWLPKRDENGQVIPRDDDHYIRSHAIDEFFKNAKDGFTVTPSGKLKIIEETNYPVSSPEKLLLLEEATRKAYCDHTVGWVQNVYAALGPHPMLHYTVDILQILLDIKMMSKDDVNEESKNTLQILASYPYPPKQREEIFKFVTTAIAKKESNWRLRFEIFKFLHIFVFVNQFSLGDHKINLFELVVKGLKDNQVEVRNLSASLMRQLLQLAPESVVKTMASRFKDLAINKRKKKRFRKGKPLLPTALTDDQRKEMIRRHAGVLGLGSIIQTYPHHIPAFLPGVLMAFVQYAHDPMTQIRSTIQKVMADFWKTHRESWHIDKKMFSDEQLERLSMSEAMQSYHV